MPSLAGNIALISGGRIRHRGAPSRERFAADGAAVAIGDIDETKGRALAQSLTRAIFVQLDVTQAHQWQSAIETVACDLGALTTLVNNAGINIPGTIADAREEDWRRIQEVNSLGFFLGCQHGVRAMAESGGSIINIASARGQRPCSGQMAYCASKALALNLTESVALYCGEKGLAIRCNAICPGVVDTPLLRRQFETMGGEDAVRERLGPMQVMGRIGAPEEIAAAASFLASDEASFVTGAALNVDGGFRIRDH